MPHNILKPLLITSLCGLFALAFSGCGESEPEYVEVRESQPAAEDPHAGHDHPPGEHPEEPEGDTGALAFTYEAPAGWNEQSPSSMKLLSLAIGSPPELVSELSVSAFPGDVGGQLANINRWRRQVGLGPISEEAAADFIQDVTVSDIEGWQVDFTGPEGSGENGGAARVVTTAVFQDGQTWFFKLVGNDAALEDELENYDAFLKSVSF